MRLPLAIYLAMKIDLHVFHSYVIKQAMFHSYVKFLAILNAIQMKSDEAGKKKMLGMFLDGIQSVMRFAVHHFPTYRSISSLPSHSKICGSFCIVKSTPLIC